MSAPTEEMTPKRKAKLREYAIRGYDRAPGLNWPGGSLAALQETLDALEAAEKREAGPDRMSWQWPKCQCGGVAVPNTSGDITRTCIRCGGIVKPDYPSNEQMAKALIADGWTQEVIGRWKAPNGALYLGPFQAWKAMNGLLQREGLFGDSRYPARPEPAGD